MTEQQFEKIKALLDASTPLQTSSKLDNKILSMAAQQVDQDKQQQARGQMSAGSYKKVLSWLQKLTQNGIAQAAVLSTALTLVVFVGMAQLFKIEQGPSFVASEQTTVEFEVSSKRVDETAPVRTAIALPTIEFEMPETQQARDQILANMPLPDINSLLNDIVLQDSSDRQFTQSVVSIAMKDIRFMLDNGQLNDARVRYARLKEHCPECELPDSLEALVVITNNSPGST